MSRQRQGLKKEHELAKEIFDATGGSVIPLRAGWSGNSAVPCPDLLVPMNGSLRAIEVKTSQQKRYIVESEEVEEVCTWAMDMTEVPTFPYLSMKFVQGNYEIYTGRLLEPWDIEKSLELWGEASPYDTNVTRTGNLSIGHPTHYDDGPPSSIKSAGDAPAMLGQLNEDEYANLSNYDRDSVSVQDVLKQSDTYWESRS